MVSEMNNDACTRASGQLKLFIDDLLTEEDYARFTAHVEACENCKRLVRTVGSLSNQLWELGELDLPSDFTETVAFQTRHKPSAVIKTAPAVSLHPAAALKKGILVLLVGFLACTTAWLAYREVTRGKAAAPKSPAVVPAADPLELTASETSAEGGVHAAFEAFLSSDPAKPAAAINAPAAPGALIAVPEPAAPVEEAAAQQAPELPAANAPFLSRHWHYVFRNDSEASKALELIRLYAPSVPHGTDPHLIHFSLSADRAHELALNLRSLSTSVAPLRDYELSHPLNHSSTHISLYLQRAGEDETSASHWHIRVAGLTKPSQIQEVISQEGGSPDYDDRNFIIFSIPASRITALKTRLESLPGTYCNFGSASAQEPGNSTPLKVAIYILEN